MSNYKVFRQANVYDLFEQIVDNYENQTILDFGGNRGNLIRTSSGKILPENYTCLDISKDALKVLEKENPGVSSIHWNRYDRVYNSDGNDNEPFPKLKHYDIVFANSVFTHHKISEMLYCLRNLYNCSNTIYFTYIDPTNTTFFERFEEKYGGVDWSRSEGKDLSYLVSNTNMLWTVIDTEYLKKQIIKDTDINLRFETGITTWFNWMKIEHGHI